MKFNLYANTKICVKNYPNCVKDLVTFGLKWWVNNNMGLEESNLKEKSEACVFMAKAYKFMVHLCCSKFMIHFKEFFWFISINLAL